MPVLPPEQGIYLCIIADVKANEKRPSPKLKGTGRFIVLTRGSVVVAAPADELPHERGLGDIVRGDGQEVV